MVPYYPLIRLYIQRGYLAVHSRFDLWSSCYKRSSETEGVYCIAYNVDMTKPNNCSLPFSLPKQTTYIVDDRLLDLYRSLSL